MQMVHEACYAKVLKQSENGVSLKRARNNASHSDECTPENSPRRCCSGCENDFSPAKTHQEQLLPSANYYRKVNNYFKVVKNSYLRPPGDLPAKLTLTPPDTTTNCRGEIQQLDDDEQFFTLFLINPDKLSTLHRLLLKKQLRKNDNDSSSRKNAEKRPIHRAGLHEAFDRRACSTCVVKIIHKIRLPPSAGGDLLWRRLCKKLLRISPLHPGLMTVTDVFETSEKFYIVSETLKGGELFEFLLREKAVPEELCKYIIKQILQALDFLHLNSLVHRDVKPENLMFRRKRPTISDDAISEPTDEKKTRVMTSLECSQTMSLQELASTFELVMIDFDTCKMTDAGSTSYREIVNGRRRLVGTYGYLAPEVLKGHEYTRVSDLWSVGVILYILITGAPPVPMEIMVNAQSSYNVLENTKRSGIDFSLAPFPEFPKAQNLCRGLLEFDPLRRIQTACEALSHEWFRPSATSLLGSSDDEKLYNYETSIIKQVENIKVSSVSSEDSFCFCREKTQIV